MARTHTTEDGTKREATPHELIETLQQDVPPQEATLRVGNARPERVPVHADQDDPGRYWVHFSDISTELRHILDCCPDVELRVDGVKEQGGRGFNNARSSPRPGPVLQWRHDS